jgi:23S rRNA pseudouridine2605 synthase
MNTKKGGKRDSRKSADSGKSRGKKALPPKKNPLKASRPAPSVVKDKPVEEKKISARDKSKYIDFKIRVKKGDPMPKFNDDSIRLNKYLSNAGVCSRRDADVLIQTGVVTVNDKIVTEMGYRVALTDKVQYDGETINPETKRYVVLNKPKGFITSIDDPMGRKTVMSLVKKACRERIYPIDRLDKETTGLLFFTNDGDIAKKLTHPQFKAMKLYHVEVSKPVQTEHLEKLMAGIQLEDGKTIFTKAEHVKNGGGREIGVELHSGKTNVVRRAFEAIGYTVVKLDRVKYAGLTKKDLPRGNYRHLSEQEVSYLKMAK